MNTMNRILQSIQGLPPFPDVARKVLSILNNPEYQVSEVVRVIEFDPSITAGVLRMANSPFFGLSRQVGSVRQAVSLLGQRSLRQVIMASGALNYFRTDSVGYGVKGQDLWRHSVACAIMSQILERRLRLNLKVDQDAFTVGLLHDIGKLVLSTFVQEELERILFLVEERGYSFIEAEREIFGVDHAELGAQVTRKWKFPVEIVQAIRYHHAPQHAETGDELTPVIYLANIACLLLGQGGSGIDGLNYRGYSDVMHRFRLRIRDLEAGLIVLEEEIRKSEELLQAG